ncbi:hypothetical protein NFI96_013133 [Prochilodus magdalenae]|nr:hypothetical protein NFI96_013133 [Prochilodus magdalenae]
MKCALAFASPRTVRMRGRAAALALPYGFLLWWICSAQTLQEAAAVCTCKNLTRCEQTCDSAEESHGFICFGQRFSQGVVDYKCKWNHKQYRTYTLYIKQIRCKQLELESHTMMSKPFGLRNSSMTAYAIAVSEDKKSCVIAKFTGHRSQMIHCDPPTKNSTQFTRRRGYLNVRAKWEDETVKQYYLKYREQNSTSWKWVLSQDSSDSVVGNLTSYLSYEIQIHCAVTTDCPQCPLSEVISIPQELVDTPTIEEMNEMPVSTGQREVMVKWQVGSINAARSIRGCLRFMLVSCLQYVHSDAVEGYNVTVWKASGELAVVSSYILTAQTVELILSYSAYIISISAFNSAGASPPAYGFIEAKDNVTALDSEFNVSVKSNNNVSLSWSKQLSQEYACYSVEWWESGKNASYESFFDRNAYHELHTKNAPFQPYKRYHFFLHARPYKDTCNLKSINNSEQTYGRASAYLLEGVPLAAPGNISVSNITQSSFVLTWSPVAEEDLRGFLQGYIIYYSNAIENSKRNITVDPHVNSYKMTHLESQSRYLVQLSAYTTAGEGKQSDVIYLDTHLDAVTVGGMLAGVVLGIIALLLAVHVCCRLLQRSKNLLWPSIPNPCNSNAVQKIEGGQELEMLEPLYRQNLEETEEHVSVVEVKKDTSCSSTLPLFIQGSIKSVLVPVTVAEDNLTPEFSTPVTIPDCESAEAVLTDSNETDSAPVTLAGTTGCSENSTAHDTVDTSNARAVECVSKTPANPPAFVSDYTTMELFQQISKAGVQGPSSQAGNSETAPSSNSGQDYIRQGLSYMENSQHERCF